MSQFEKNGLKAQESDSLSTAGNDEPFIPIEEPGMSPEQTGKILERRAFELARLSEDEAASETLNLLLFQLNGGRYAIEVTRVREIFPRQPVTAVPRTPGFVIGIFSARGRLISVVDLGLILGLSATAVEPETKIIVVADDEIEVGFLADRVEDVTTIFAESLEPALSNQTSAQAHFTRGISAGFTAVLDIEAILRDPRLIINEEL